jgi:hypothetical protein
MNTYCTLAGTYTFGDRFFQSNQGASGAAHQFIFAGTSQLTNGSSAFQASNSTDQFFAIDNPASTTNQGCQTGTSNYNYMHSVGGQGIAGNTASCFTLTSNIFPLFLDAGSVTWRYYTPTGTATDMWNTPNLYTQICGTLVSGQCTGTDWVNNVAIGSPTVLNDIANNTLAQVSWVIPSRGNSDHPNNPANGPAWILSIWNQICVPVSSVCTGSRYADTVMIVIWDDWGGFYDHVPPNVAAGVPNGSFTTAGPGIFNNYISGFRTPLMVLSRYAKRGYISHITHTSGSIQRYIQGRFGLTEGGAGYTDALATDDMSDIFDYTLTSNLQPLIPIPLDRKTGEVMDARYFLTHPEIPGRPDEYDDDDVAGPSPPDLDTENEIYKTPPLPGQMTLLADLSSKLPSGTPIKVKGDDEKIYSGHIVTHHSRHWLRRGSLRIEFDVPVTVTAVHGHKMDSEGTVKAGHRRQVAGAAVSVLAAQSFDDYVLDPALRHKNPAWYGADAALVAGTLFLQKGGEVKLKAGTVLDVEPIR